MFDAEIGLEKGDSINLKIGVGSIFVWNDNGKVMIAVSGENDVLHVYVDEQTLEIEAVTSPHDAIKVPVMSWQECLRRNTPAGRIELTRIDTP